MTQYLAFVHWHFDGEDDTLILDVEATNDADAERAAEQEAQAILSEDSEIFGVTLHAKGG